MRKTPDPRVLEFIRWSELHLEQRERALTAEQLGKRFVDQRLFGDDDGDGFRPPHWY